MWILIAILNYKIYTKERQRSQAAGEVLEEEMLRIQAYEQFNKKLVDLLRKLDKKYLRKQGVKIDVISQQLKREPNW